MKQLFVFLALLISIHAGAQSFNKVPLDSIAPLLGKVQEIAGVKLSMRQRTDSLQDYLYYDSTGYLRIRVQLKTGTHFEGMKAISANYVDYVKITGPDAVIDEVFKYLKSVAVPLESGAVFVNSKKWDARLRDDEKIESLEGKRLTGKAIGIMEHN